MEHVTIGKKYNKGKVAFVECVKNGSLEAVDIKDKCFLLIILTKGKMDFEIGTQTITATAPCFLCFDELENPVLLSKSKAHYTCVYFHPGFLNINMTFDLLRCRNYIGVFTSFIFWVMELIVGVVKISKKI